MKNHTSSFFLHWICNTKYRKPLYFVFCKVNGYIEENYKSQHLTLTPTNENKYTIKMYEEMWNQIKFIFNRSSPPKAFL